jgi:hypothetical protein
MNDLIGSTWKQATSEKKETLKKVLLSEREVIEDLLELYKKKPALLYDFESDPAGEVAWYRAAKMCIQKFPLQVGLSAPPKPEEVLEVVTTICAKFKDLIENNGLCAFLYDDIRTQYLQS